MRKIGTVSMGIRCPIIKEGDDLVKIVTDSVIEAAGSNLRDRDIIAITESVVARAQGNYVTITDIATDVKNKTDGDTVGLVFPILSRNRFAICLRGIAAGVKKVVLMFSYPADEKGNALITPEKIMASTINPYTTNLTLEEYRILFGKNLHPFTGIDYVEYYQSLIEEAGAKCEIIFSNNPEYILNYTDTVIACDIHTRAYTKQILTNYGAKLVLGLDDILNKPINNSGYNSKYGLLGSNKATENKVKLFPNDCLDRKSTRLNSRI